MTKEELEKSLDFVCEERERLQDRIDKAIEYIEKQYELIKDSDERWQPVLDNKKLLNILRGKEK